MVSEPAKEPRRVKLYWSISLLTLEMSPHKIKALTGQQNDLGVNKNAYPWIKIGYGKNTQE